MICLVHKRVIGFFDSCNLLDRGKHILKAGQALSTFQYIFFVLLLYDKISKKCLCGDLISSLTCNAHTLILDSPHFNSKSITWSTILKCKTESFHYIKLPSIQNKLETIPFKCFTSGWVIQSLSLISHAVEPLANKSKYF